MSLFLQLAPRSFGLGRKPGILVCVPLEVEPTPVSTTPYRVTEDWAIAAPEAASRARPIRDFFIAITPRFYSRAKCLPPKKGGLSSRANLLFGKLGHLARDSPPPVSKTAPCGAKIVVFVARPQQTENAGGQARRGLLRIGFDRSRQGSDALGNLCRRHRHIRQAQAVVLRIAREEGGRQAQRPCRAPPPGAAVFAHPCLRAVAPTGTCHQRGASSSHPSPPSLVQGGQHGIALVFIQGANGGDVAALRSHLSSPRPPRAG